MTTPNAPSDGVEDVIAWLRHRDKFFCGKVPAARSCMPDHKCSCLMHSEAADLLTALRLRVAELEQLLVRPTPPETYCIEIHYGELHLRKMLHRVEREAWPHLAKRMMQEMDAAIS